MARIVPINPLRMGNPVLSGTGWVGRPSINSVVAGDSITADSFGLSNFYWFNGRCGGVLKLIANIGVSSNTVGNLLARIDNLYTDPNPGLAGLGTIGELPVRIGTNNARGNDTLASIQADWTTLLNKCAGYAAKVRVLGVPPLNDGTPAHNVKTQDYEAWLAATWNTGQFTWCPDCQDLRDGSGNQITSLFVDGIHPNGAGVYLMGKRLYTILGTEIASYGYTSPVNTDPLNVYPTFPQWVDNPTLTGTGGSTGTGFTGTAPTNYNVAASGAGVAGTCSIVAADGGDPNQVPWLRIVPTQGQNGSRIAVTVGMQGRSITTSDPSALESIIQVRGNSLDMTSIGSFQYFWQASTGDNLISAAPALMGDTGGVLFNEVATMRSNFPRSGAHSGGLQGSLVYVQFQSNIGPGASIGSFDIRCLTVTG